MTTNHEFPLTSKQRDAVGLLSIGTFLEYFDLMLYMHMAVLLNDLFFPSYGPTYDLFKTAFAFCSTYLLRPFGAIIFGYIGDFIGRKAVVIITTLLMAFSCSVLAALPTYAQIGITASWLITIIRMTQGVAATAESTGAELYLTESSKPPVQYPLVALITVFSGLGTTAALGVGAIFTNNVLFQSEDSWRIAFIIGAVIALVGTIARTTLKEADEFSNKRKKLKARLKDNKIKWADLHEDFFKQKTSYYISLAYFLVKCARRPCFYFIYFYSANVLKHNFGYTANQIITQNFWVSIVDAAGLIGLAYLSYKINPLKILKAKFFLFFTVILAFPFVLSSTNNSTYVFIFQCLAALFVFDHVPASPIFYQYFPIFRRFTYTSLISATAKLATYFFASFGLAITTAAYGYWGVLVIFIPVGLGFYFSVNYFQRLEAKKTLT